MRVIHQEDPGGPSHPRNRGPDIASGRYVYFLDADDYLGSEALERMLTLAGENGSDLVAISGDLAVYLTIGLPGAARAAGCAAARAGHAAIPGQVRR